MVSQQACPHHSTPPKQPLPLLLGSLTWPLQPLPLHHSVLKKGWSCGWAGKAHPTDQLLLPPTQPFLMLHGIHSTVSIS